LRLERDVLLVRSQIEIGTKCDVPLAQQASVRKQAIFGFDFVAANMASKKILQIERERGKLELSWLQKSLPIEMAILSVPDNEFKGNRQEVQQKYDRLIKDARHRLELFMTSHRGFTATGEAICDDAYLAGAANDLKERYQLRMDGLKYAATIKPGNTQRNASLFGQLMMEYAERFAELTGNRTEAAKTYRQGWELKHAGESSVAFDSLGELPAWWPSGDP
jgi:hypothetical protein